MLKDLLRRRDEAQKEVTNDRLNQIYSKLLKDKETKQQKIHNDYLRCKITAVSALTQYSDHKCIIQGFCLCFLIHLFFFIVILSVALRKLEAKRRNVEGKREQPVKSYADSRPYAPGSRRDTFTRNKELKNYYLDTSEGLDPCFWTSWI